jgi:hypothetical protein
MRTLMRPKRALGGAAVLLLGTATLLAAAAPALALDAAAERERIGQTLQSGYQQGYAGKNAASILALYDEKAEITTFTSGKVDKAAFGALLGQTLERWQSASAKVFIEDAAFPSDTDARIAFSLQIEAVAPGSKPTTRQDRWFALMHRGDKGWLILKQGYREDFGVSASAHTKRTEESTGSEKP